MIHLSFLDHQQVYLKSLCEKFVTRKAILISIKGNFCIPSNLLKQSQFTISYVQKKSISPDLQHSSSSLPILLLPDLDIVNQPILIGESTRICRNISLTSRSLTSTRTRRPNFSCPSSTECSIEDYVLICKKRIKITTPLPLKVASGVPQEGTLVSFDLICDGMDPRGQNHMQMPLEAHCIAYTPPPIALKPAP